MNELPLTPELCDSLRMLSLKRRQGVLEILSAEREYELTFLEGKIVHVDRLDQPYIDYLLKRLPSEERQKVSLAQCESLGRAETIAVIAEQTAVAPAKLIFLKKQYDRECLLLLGREKSCSFDFRTRIVRCESELSLDLSPGHFLLDLLESREMAQPLAHAPIPPQPAVLPNVTEPALNSKEPVVKRKKIQRRKRPARVGRWQKTTQRSNKKKRLQFSTDKILTGVKLAWFLSLVVVVPTFLVDWLQQLSLFLSLRQ